jgi:hypothetical protein
MATTSPEAAQSAVAAIEEAGVRFAVLHNEEGLARGATSSDVDIVADRSVHDVVQVVGQRWHRVGLHPVVVWPYDVGGTGSIFLSTADAGDGVQLDVLFDTRGRGRYGVHSGMLLDAGLAGERFPTVAPPERLAYLLAKRIYKGELDEAARLAKGASAAPDSIALNVLEPATARDIRDFLKDGSGQPRQSRLGLGRLMSRIRTPIGAWIEVEGQDAKQVAAGLASRFGRFLPHAVSLPAPSLGTWVTGIAPVRWRAGIVATYGTMGSTLTPRPDVSIQGPHSTDAACHMTVAALTHRILGTGSGPG